MLILIFTLLSIHYSKVVCLKSRLTYLLLNKNLYLTNSMRHCSPSSIDMMEELGLNSIPVLSNFAESFRKVFMITFQLNHVKLFILLFNFTIKKRYQTTNYDINNFFFLPVVPILCLKH
jgi:hypothetical protein